MLGLGSNITKAGKIGKPIVKDGLVLKHGYTGGPVQPVSTGAVFLDGDNDEIVIGDVMDLGTDDFSITAWVKINTASSSTVENYIVSKIVDSDNTIKIAFNWATDKFVMTATGGGNSVAGHSTTTAITSAMKNSWIHVAFTCDRDGDSSVYINGVAGAYGKVIGSSNSSQSLDSSGGWAIGGNAAGTFGNFDGYICNVGIWKGAALTQPQIKSIMHKDYASLSDSEKTNLVSWWNLDSTIPDVSTEVYDNHYGGGDELGSELIRNGDFSSDSGWTLSADAGNSTAEISGGTLNITVGAGDGYVYGMQTDGNMNAEYVSGSIYAMEATFTRTSGSGGRLRFQDNLSDTGGLTDALTQTELTGGEQSVKFYFKANSNSDTLAIARDNGASGLPVTVKVKSISLKLVNGNTGTLS